MLPTLDIIIVNWNTGSYLRECLESIAASNHDGFVLNRVVVVDNASVDGSADYLDDIDVPLTLLRNRENRGFAAACNQGAKGSDANYLLFLNPDTRLLNTSLSVPIRFMQQPENAKIGICGIQLVDDKGLPSVCCAKFPKLQLLFLETIGLSKFFPQSLPKRMIKTDEINHNTEVDQIIGAFFLVRSYVYQELVGFDEQFFVYFEEVDFSLRAKQRGYFSYYLRDTSAYHKGGGSSETVKSHRLCYVLKSKIRYGVKHFSLFESSLLILLVMLLEFIFRIFYGLFQLSVPQITETIGGYRLFLSTNNHRPIKERNYHDRQR